MLWTKERQGDNVVFRGARVLDSVEGIGPARKKALIKAFGSLQGIRDASVDDLRAVGISERVAVRLKELL